MKIIITGGRDHPLFTASGERAFLDRLHEATPITEVVTGGATGADAEGLAWARMRGIDTTIMPANWAGHGKAAGPIRNKRMAAYLFESAEYGECAVVAFPGGRGTANMLETARLAGIRVIRYPEDAQL